mmetsp:Transcript_8226/g.23028  ORF Transcript_8226/g.23028 Transcript_8226/m.23028 type:complete len:247 (-) Transcript_8226:697-1437(-)
MELSRRYPRHCRSSRTRSNRMRLASPRATAARGSRGGLRKDPRRDRPPTQTRRPTQATPPGRAGGKEMEMAGVMTEIVAVTTAATTLVPSAAATSAATSAAATTAGATTAAVTTAGMTVTGTALGTTTGGRTGGEIMIEIETGGAATPGRRQRAARATGGTSGAEPKARRTRPRRRPSCSSARGASRAQAPARTRRRGGGRFSAGRRPPLRPPRPDPRTSLPMAVMRARESHRRPRRAARGARTAP